jgi:hypothetical protein
LKTRRVDPKTGLQDYLRGLKQDVKQALDTTLGTVVVREQIVTYNPGTAVSATHGLLPDGTIGYQEVTPPGKLVTASFGPSAVISPHDSSPAPGIGFSSSSAGPSASSTGISSDDGSTLDISAGALTLNGRQVHTVRFGEFNGAAVSQTAAIGSACGAFTSTGGNIGNDFCTPGTAGTLAFSKTGAYMVTYFANTNGTVWNNMHIWAVNYFNSGLIYLSESRGPKYGNFAQSATFVVYIDTSSTPTIEFGATYDVNCTFTSTVRVVPMY